MVAVCLKETSIGWLASRYYNSDINIEARQAWLVNPCWLVCLVKPILAGCLVDSITLIGIFFQADLVSESMLAGLTCEVNTGWPDFRGHVWLVWVSKAYMICGYEGYLSTKFTNNRSTQ